MVLYINNIAMTTVITRYLKSDVPQLLFSNEQTQTYLCQSIQRFCHTIVVIRPQNLISTIFLSSEHVLNFGKNPSMD